MDVWVTGQAEANLHRTPRPPKFFAMTAFPFNLPDKLAADARAAGLLSDERLEALIVEQLRAAGVSGNGRNTQQDCESRNT